jgi:CysZ protein
VAPLDLATASAYERFFVGFRHALGGVPAVLRSRRLLALCAVPMAVQAAVFVAMAAVAFHYMSRLVPATSAHGWQNALWHVLLFALFGASILMALLLAGRLSSILCDPVYDLISEHAEALAAGGPVVAAEPWKNVPGNILRELVSALLALLLYGAGTLLIAVLGLIPVVGVVLNAILGLVWTWLYVAHEYLSRSLGRHGLGASARVSAILANRAIAAGFGAAAWLLLFIPLSSPFIEVGAARLHLRLAAHGLVPSRLAPEVRLRLRG